MDVPPPAPWLHVGAHVERAATEPLGLALLTTAVASTVVIAGSGLDHQSRLLFADRLGSDAAGDVAIVAGYVTPIVVPLALYGLGVASPKLRPLSFHGAAVAQAVVVTFGVTLALKFVTGRTFPLHGGDPRARDRFEHPEYARDFEPFRADGVLAWPSGHASVMFAAASALATSTNDRSIAIASYGIASGVSVGMLVGDHHWLSDVISGAMLGVAVGDAVGRGFHALRVGPEGRSARASRKATYRLVPLTVAGPARTVGAGLLVTGF